MKIWGLGFLLPCRKSSYVVWLFQCVFLKKSLLTIIKIVKNKLIEYKKLFCGLKALPGRMKTFDTAKESLDPIFSLK